MPFSNQERIEASKNLYRQVFSIAHILPEDSVLEVGCGKGLGLQLLAKELNPKRCVGLDLNARFVSFAQRSNADISFMEEDACNFQLMEQFSHIICVEASQHFLDIDGFLLSANKSLTPGGKITLAGFFIKQDSDLEYLKDNIETVKNNIDIVRNINALKQNLLDRGFEDIQIISIGDHVILQYEAWLEQVSYENIWAKEWKSAFEKGKLDYYIVSAILSKEPLK